MQCPVARDQKHRHSIATLKPALWGQKISLTIYFTHGEIRVTTGVLWAHGCAMNL